MLNAAGDLRASGDLELKVIPGNFGSPAMDKLSIGEMVRFGMPRYGLDPEVNRWRSANFWNMAKGYRLVRSALRSRAPAMVGSLYLAHISPEWGRRELGLAGTQVVSDAFADFLVDSFQDTESFLIDLFKFHGIGTSSAAEDQTDTDLTTEITTEYDTNNVRPTGTQTEGASSNIYRTVGTITVDAQVLTREHAVFTNATVGSGTMLDRTLFALVTLENGDSLQATYELTITAGG